jgi:hypothetical protein
MIVYMSKNQHLKLRVFSWVLFSWIYCALEDGENKTLEKIFTYTVIQYSQRHSMINHCDRHACIIHLGDLDLSFVILNIYGQNFYRRITFLSDTDTVQ